MGLSVAVIETSELGDRSYVAHDGEIAVVVDPQRDLDRVEALVDELGVRVGMVVETHIHNDYVTGGLELARRTGADYLVAGADAVEFSRDAVGDGDERTVGTLTVRVVATPGHTDTHLSYLVDDGVSMPAVFTGGSLLFGSVGRTDLVDPARTEELTRAQFHSARRLAELLDNDTAVYPTHGFGSFCSSGAATGGDASTIGIERTRNDALVETDESAFVERLVAGLTAYPSYYAHMGARNRQGPGPADLSAPESVDPDELRHRIKAGEWVVDLRDRTAYTAEHIGGTIGIALGTQFATYLGWLIPWGTPLTLIGESAQQVTDAQRQLVRIGIDRPSGAASGTPGELAAPDELRSYPSSTFAELTHALDRGDAPVVLDVRRHDERTGGHIPGSAHIPLNELLDRLDEIPDGELWVHCASGFRASIGASLLFRAGHRVVLVDDEYAKAVDTGLAVTSPSDQENR
ncbi:rhodanese-like domain-containing protein [Pseudonocardia sp. N23]|uniref:MBL fold metallo-hydrolase n=1 Tax=Pseudonocardia sp. N23 TaxID=1987376 RepID=UPI000C035832|nr:MBL fold metallo-hydrolase [Pseudonocardia sp. N23]GAY10960.1 hydroxyacylglutathione hydrolase [Pseudonocardia sp. N23]